MSLRLLHLSDIHFISDGWDEDADQRNELLRDLRAQVAAEGAMDGVLVGGDIAFSAKPEEYVIALGWIDEILEACGGLDRSRVWTVPGNHDINRQAVKESAEALRFRLEMATCDAQSIDFHLKRSLSLGATADELMEPLAAYNDFAMQFGCAVRAEAPRWFDERTLALDGWRVRLTGLTSVLTSGAGTERGHLVVGCHQTRLERKDGLIDLVMMHHPPTWIRDWQHIEPYMRRAHVWVFGHEHSYAANQEEPGGSVEVSAGAVAPERDATGDNEPFVASYNVITLDRNPDDLLSVAIHPRYWDLTSTQFTLHPDGLSSFLVSVLPQATSAELPAETRDADDEDTGTEEIVSAVPLAPELAGEEPEATELEVDRMQVLRRIGVEYLGLPAHRRITIARNLGVFEPGDLEMRPAELFPRILERIRDRNLIDNLTEELRN